MRRVDATLGSCVDHQASGLENDEQGLDLSGSVGPVLGGGPTVFRPQRPTIVDTFKQAAPDVTRQSKCKRALDLTLECEFDEAPESARASPAVEDRDRSKRQALTLTRGLDVSSQRGTRSPEPTVAIDVVRGHTSPSSST